MNVRYFDLQGASLGVSATDATLIAAFGGVLDQTGLEQPSAPVCFELALEIGKPEEPPAGAVLLHQGPVLDEGEAIALDDGGEIVQMFPGKASLRVSGSRARLIVAPDEVRRIRMNLGMLALEAATRVAGQVPLHSAGLTLPNGDMVVVIGPSGAGKTTAALALCGAGLGLCSDDLIFLRISENSVVGWGLPRSMKVHRHTVSMLPWSGALLTGDWSDEDERPLPLANLRQAARVEDCTPRRVAAIYLLQRSTEAKSAVVPVAQVEVFAAAASDNLRTSYVGITASHAARFAALAELFRRVPAFGLVAGANPADLGDTVIAHHKTMVAQ
jgi:hypothetical protein